MSPASNKGAPSPTPEVLAPSPTPEVLDTKKDTQDQDTPPAAPSNQTTPPAAPSKPAAMPAGARLPPPSQDAMPPPAEVSQGALDRRLRRVMEPNAKGQYKVSEEIRKMWNQGQKDKVFKLFAECENDPTNFTKKFSIKKDQEKEVEVGVFFTFKTEEEMADMSEKLHRTRNHQTKYCFF